MSKRWIYQGNTLQNWQRPVSPKLVVIKQIGSGVLNTPPIKRRHKK